MIALPLLGHAVVEPSRTRARGDRSLPEREPLLWADGFPRRSARRRPVDPGVPESSSAGSRSNEISLELARRLSYVLGPMVPVVERYWESLSFAPAEHLRRLCRNGTVILFGVDIPLALDSPWANARRGRLLTTGERAYYAREFSKEAGAAAVYDGLTDAIVLPTAYSADPEIRDDVVMHELGHALTWRAAWHRASQRADLLIGLPPAINAHVFSDAYLVAGDKRTTTQFRVLEALAEAYVWLAADRADELPPRLTSELIGILSGDGMS